MTALLEQEQSVDRFDDPLYTVVEASRYLGVPGSTLRTWARGYENRANGRVVSGEPVITYLSPHRRGGAAIPFVGLAEGYALTAIRRSGVSLQRVRPALEALKREIGVSHALASKRLYTDGAEVLFDYSRRSRDGSRDAAWDLTVVRNGQRVFPEVIEAYLQRITWATDGYAISIPLPGFTEANVVADVRRGFGQPTFERSGARLEDVLALFDAGESIASVAEEFGLDTVEVEDAIRHHVTTS